MVIDNVVRYYNEDLFNMEIATYPTDYISYTLKLGFDRYLFEELYVIML